MSGRFRASAGRIDADVESWLKAGVQVSALARMHLQAYRDANGALSPVTPFLLLEFVDAIEEAARQATRGPSLAKAEERTTETVWVTTREAAARMGCTEQWVRQLARTERIRARRHGQSWLIASEAVDRAAPRAS